MYSMNDLRGMTAADCGKALAIGRDGYGWLELDNGMSIAFSKMSEGKMTGTGDVVADYIVEFLPNDEPESHIDEISVDGFYSDAEFDLAAFAAMTEVIIPALEKAEV